MQSNDESTQNVNSSANLALCSFDKSRTRELQQGAEPSTDNITNVMTEDTHRVNMSSGLPNPIEQHKTRVSELSIIDLNDPLPSKCANSPPDYDAERKTPDGRLQETNKQYRHGQIQEGDRRGNKQFQQSRHSGIKSRHDEVTGFTRKQTQASQERNSSQAKAGPSQYYNKRRKECTSGSAGQKNCIGKQQQGATLN